jgi:hypothetical protein
LTYDDIPKLTGTLISNDFIVKVRGEEIYRGKFYSMALSMSYNGYVILESMMKLDEEHHSIMIFHGYPTGDFTDGSELRDDPRIIKALKDKGLLR